MYNRCGRLPMEHRESWTRPEFGGIRAELTPDSRARFTLCGATPRAAPRGLNYSEVSSTRRGHAHTTVLFEAVRLPSQPLPETEGMNAPPKKSHSVARFILQNFSDETGQLHVWNIARENRDKGSAARSGSRARACPA